MSDFDDIFEDFALPVVEDLTGDPVLYLKRGEAEWKDAVGIWLPDEIVSPSPTTGGKYTERGGDLLVGRLFLGEAYLPKEGDEFQIPKTAEQFMVISVRSDHGTGYRITGVFRRFTQRSAEGLRREGEL